MVCYEQQVCLQRKGRSLMRKGRSLMTCEQQQQQQQH
jgi:hypothetical protein